MIYNHICKSIRSTDRDMWMYKVFLIQDEKEPIFITGHEKQEESPRYKAFKQT